MSNRKSIVGILIAALLIAGAGQAWAKQQASGDVTSAQQQGNKKSKQAVRYCRRMPPPFMYNPRFMNRGFFKKKCPAQDQ